MTIPQRAREIIRRTVEEFKDDAARACREAVARIRADPDVYAETAAYFFGRGVTEDVYAVRKEYNRIVRAELGLGHTVQKVGVGTTSVEAAYRSMYDYRLAGKTLGSLTGGSELHDVVQQLKAQFDGVGVNWRLARVLLDTVPEGVAVRDIYTDQALRNLMARCTVEQSISTSAGEGAA